ncbi:hypothetical protein [Thalassobius sp. Cn5-15]|uniref:hypothetical protein n=1 Tax=Thalassobius sp. Cn5-15 TaxID=2917763 RepID=UPI001EF3CE17|nr:hypothetical protein [Thalassobius sp. Cn5-15]MCG7492482.1 hypothetical protein [Thalassobius sp. Cn5-15]
MADTNLIPVDIIPDQADPLAGGAGGGTTGLASGALSGNTLTLTANDGSVITVNVASLMDDTNLARITSASLTGVTLTLTRDDTSDVTVDLSGLQTTFGAATTAADDATGAGGSSTNAAHADHKHAAQAPSGDANNAITVGTDGLHFVTIPDEVVRSTTNLTGAAPAGTEWGVNIATGAAFFVDPSGNWQPVPTATVDMNLTVADAAGNDMGLAPLSAPASPDDGDVHLEVYDDGARWFTRTNGSWAVSASFTGMAAVSPATGISPASDDAAGAVGTVARYAREDHKHPAQAPSGDAEQLLKAGSDGLHMLDPDDLISVDADNDLVKGSDGKLFVPEDRKITFHNAAGSNLGAVPANAPTGAKEGDIHVEAYDDGVRWFEYYDTPPLPAGWQTSLTHVKAAGKTRVFIPNSGMNPSASGAPTDAEAQAVVNAGGAANYDRVFYYNGTDDSTNDATYAWLSDPTNGKLTRILEPTTSAKDRVFLSNTTVDPDTRLQPTDAEAITAIGAAVDVLAYYTGTDTATDPVTHAWHVDASGNVSRVETRSLTPRGNTAVSETLAREGVYRLDHNDDASYSITLPDAVGSQEVRIVTSGDGEGIPANGGASVNSGSPTPFDPASDITLNANGQTIIQSFVAEYTGRVITMEIYGDEDAGNSPGASSNTFQVSLYEGEGTGGTLISQSSNGNFGSTRYLASSLGGGASPGEWDTVQGQTYTMVIEYVKVTGPIFEMRTTNTNPAPFTGFDVIGPNGSPVAGQQLAVEFKYNAGATIEATDTTISVPSGQKLNGVTDGTFDIPTTGGMAIIVDAGVGEWSVGLFEPEKAADPAPSTTSQAVTEIVLDWTDVANGGTVATGKVWNTLSPEFQEVTVYFEGHVGSTFYFQEVSVRVEDLKTGGFFHAVDGIQNADYKAAFSIADMTTDGLVIDLRNWATPTRVKMVAKRAQQVVIPESEATVVHDQNNYLDIGNKRIQWGIQPGSDSADTIALPQPFANANYSLSFALESVGSPGIAISSGGDVDFTYWIVSGSKTTTQFQVDRDDDVNSAQLNWTAIGDKP